MKKNYNFFVALGILFILVVLIFLIFFIIPKNNATSNVIKEPNAEVGVYFCPEDMCKEKLLALIDSSSDIKCAFYELNLYDVISKLKAKNADVVIEDSTYKNGSGFHTGFSQALMHNKFCVFDNKTIFSGSMNPTVNDNFYNNNNIIIIKSAALAKNYLDEFSELKNDIYGKGTAVKDSLINIGDMAIENYFCPDDKCKLHVINALKKANSSIYFMTYSFTDVDIGNLLYNKHYQGVDVKGIFDESQLSDFSRYEELKDFSIIDKNKYKLHDKVFIIDNETVITGSYNPTQNADQFNDENIIIIHDKGVAAKYAKEFSRLYDFEPALSNSSHEMVITKVLYDPLGADEGHEVVELKNNGPDIINLEYYSISDNKTNMKLNGTLNPEEKIEIKPKFSLKNTNGMLFLKHNSDIIDYVYWEGIWKLVAKEGQSLVRINTSRIDSAAWQILG